jgi:hypothetical protein
MCDVCFKLYVKNRSRQTLYSIPIVTYTTPFMPMQVTDCFKLVTPGILYCTSILQLIPMTEDLCTDSGCLLRTVLPGAQEDSPPIGQKYTAI